MNSTRVLRSDVLIIGGGPAGAAAAIELSRLGDRVVLVDARRASRHGPCQSLPLSALPLLDRLDAADAVAEDAGYHPAPLEVNWDGPGLARDERTVPVEGLHLSTATSILIDRDGFDRTLRERAQAQGTTVLEPTMIVSLQAPVAGHHDRGTCEDPKAWIAILSGQGQIVEVQAHIVVIATGRMSSFGGRRRRCGPATLALSGIWRNPNGTPWSVCEAGAHAWHWAGALPDGRTSVISMVDPHSPLFGRHTNLDAAYRELVASTTIIRRRLHGPLTGGVHAMDSSRQLISPVARANCLRVGDAAATLDPLSSQGIVVALTSAIQGAIAVHTMLRRPKNTPLAIAFCEQRQREVIERDQRHAGVHYARRAAAAPTAFWRARATPLPPEPSQVNIRDQRIDSEHLVWLHPAVRVEPTPILTARFIEQAPALAHPALDRPIAFIGVTPVCELLRPLLTGRPVHPEDKGDWTESPAPGSAYAREELRLAELITQCDRLLPPGCAVPFVDSLIARGVLIAGPDAIRAPTPIGMAE